MTFLLIFAGAALAISFMCSLLEATLLSYTPSQVAALETEKPRIFAIWRRFKDDIEMPIAVILVTNTISHTVGATMAGAQAEKIFGSQGLVVFSLVFTFLMLQFTEILPKSLGVRFNHFLAPIVAPPLDLLARVMRPLLWFIHLINKPFTGRGEVEDNTLEQISGLAASARLSRLIDPQHARMIEAASDFDEIRVRHIMTPRTDMISLSVDQPIEEILKIVTECPFTRMPLWEESIDNVIGVVNAKDIFKALKLMPGHFHIAPDASEGEPAATILETAPETDKRVLGLGSLDLLAVKRDIVVFPEHISILQALRDFQRERQHMAIVVDEYGSTQGVVTLEDVLEEMVGEIEDEFDPAPPEMIREEGAGYRVRGRVMLYELQQHIRTLAIDLPSIQSDTVGGFVTEQMGRMPDEGDSIVVDGWQWTVTEADERQVHEIFLEPLAEETPPPGE